MKRKNKLFLLFSSAVLGSTLAIAIPQNTSTISAETVAAQPAAVNPSAPYANGVYPNTPMAYHKSGTQETSIMAQFMKPMVTITINGANATLSLPADDSESADMLKKFTINGKNTVRKGNNFEVVMPSNTINKVLKGYVEVLYKDAKNKPHEEKQPVDIKIDTSNIKKAVAPKPTPQPEKPKTDQQKKAEQEAEKRRAEQQKQDEKKRQEAEKRRAEQQRKADAQKRAQEREQDRKSGNPTNKLDIVDYTANYKNKTTGQQSTMANYMSPKAKLYYKGGHQYIVISANSSDSANMIKDMRLNGRGYFKKIGNDFYFNFGTKEIQKNSSITFAGKVSVSTRIRGKQFTENPEFTLTLSNRRVHKGDSSSLHTGSGSIGKPVPSTSTNKSNGSSGGSVAVAKNSYYNYSAQFLKQGTSESSVMATYMLNAAHVEIKGNNATITVFANSASSANMITHMTLGGQTASRSGNGYTVTLPKSELESVIAGHVDVDVPGVIHESQPFSLRLTPGFSGTPSAGGDSSSADGASAMGGNAFPMGSASNLNAASANSIAAAKKAADAKKNGAKNVDNIKNPDATAQAKDKEQSDMNKTFLSIGGIISAVLGYIGTTLGWNIFRG
ncbi:hypothetical protein D3P96_00110 [Weissella viridescens]|uniref:NEAT domain-containing protein n=1 Tax=Weissella viridescens TaxID=1629 RepID=A0A3P2RCQ2_WEIVI|nr:hypothetical protein [Weissella viridescens]RRG18427.1 hypothetical protein D3P96_00110 [Weissella viridescens]